MEDRYCANCGSARDPEHTFCPKCGRSFTPNTSKPSGSVLHHPIIGRLIVLLAGAVVLWMIYTLANSPALRPTYAADYVAAAPTPLPTPTPVPTIACQQGANLVIQRHSTMWSLLASHVQGFTITCGQPTDDGLLPILLDWDYNGTHHSAVYDVSVNGVVTAANDTARKADSIASNAPAILAGLGGL